MAKHDQLFKHLLEGFLPDLLALMLPRVARDLEPESVKFLRDEHFVDPPTGARLQADLLAEVHLRSAPERAIRIHVEIERRWSATMAERLWRYNLAIRRRHPGAMLSLVLYLQGGKAGVHRQTWQDRALAALDLPAPLTFTYYSFGLAGCRAEDYLKRSQPLAWALAALMRSKLPPEQHKLACVRRILHAPVDDARRHTLLHCVDTYLPLNSRQERSFRAMLIEREGPEVLDIYNTPMEWVERIKKESATKAMRRLITAQLEQRFGALPQVTTARLERLDAEQLQDLSQRLLTASSLEELGLA